MRASTGFAGIVLGVIAACSGGGGSPVDAGGPDGAEIDGPTPDAAEADAAVVDAAVVDARPIDAAGPDAFFDGGFDPLACGTGTLIIPLPAAGVVTGAASAATPGNVSSTTCNGRGAETAYLFVVDHPVTLDATTDDPGTTLDTVLYVRTACQDPSTELACHDDVSSTNPRSHLTIDLTPGTYYLIVDGRNVGQAGDYVLTTRFYEGPGAPCTGPLDCAPDATCRAVPPATATTCEPPVCSDGRDDDGDGLVDYPADPGCTGPTDATEEDDCPAGPGCPACADGVDNDGDGAVDYPTDPSCASASADSEESCAGETEPLLPLTGATTTGTTVGATHELTPPCAAGSTAPERVHTLVLPHALATLVIDTDAASYDTVLTLFDDACTVALACDDDGGVGNRSRISRTSVAPGTYRVAVDGFGVAAGAYAIHVAGTYVDGGACDPASPMFTCGTSRQCLGAPGAETCQSSACSDGIDDDGDGLIDYPADPGCTSAADTDESDACPSGPGCPACGNGGDDDGDGFVDYPADVGCASAADDDESTPACPSETDPLLVLTSPTVTGTTAGASNDQTPICGAGSNPLAPDRVILATFTVPVAALVVDTGGSSFDTVLSVAPVSCASTLRCDDDSGPGNTSAMTLTNLDAGTYAIIIDGFASGAGAYILNVRGTLPAGGSCTDPLVAAGVLVCPVGSTCQGGVCAP